MSLLDGNDNHDGNGWSEYQKLVLHELETHSKELKEIREDVSSFKTELGILKVKSGIWGLLGGLMAAIPVAIAIIELVKNN